MHLILLFIISAAVSLGGKIFSKLCSNSVTGSSVAKYTLFLTVNGLVACLFFWLSGGLHLALNLTTLIYSLVYALIITVILISGLMVYKLATISGVNIISSTFSLVGSLLLGILLFDERVGGTHVLRVLIMLAAVLLVFLDARRMERAGASFSAESKENRENKESNESKARKRKHTLQTIAVFAAMILSGIANTAITKAFAIDPRVTDENSFFFFTNAFISLGAAVIFAVACLKNREEFCDSLKLLRPRRLVSLAGNTVCSNVGSLVGLQIMAQLDVSVYTPISSAIGILLALIGSWIFRERLGILSYLAAAVACVAVIL